MDRIIKTKNFTVESLGYKEIYVYDIETENTHRFFANNILVHNSIYLYVDEFCRKYVNEWDSKTDDEKVDVIDVLSRDVKNYINERIYQDVQLNSYNSIVEDFRIHFEREKIIKSGLFVAKKMYSVRCLWLDGKRVDKIATTGLSIARGDSSEAIRYRLKDLMDMILKGVPDADIKERVDQYRLELAKETPESLAANIGVSNIDKWVINDSKCKKGTPWHVKGVVNYKNLLKTLDIVDKYEDINEGMKVKVVYLKPNQWDMETVSFYEWPKEFDSVIQIDKEKMIDKFFINKIGILLKPINKEKLLIGDSEKSLGLFFS